MGGRGKLFPDQLVVNPNTVSFGIFTTAVCAGRCRVNPAQVERSVVWPPRLCKHVGGLGFREPQPLPVFSKLL